MRNSSVEIFRIIATFLVVIVHFNGVMVGIPQKFAGFTIPNISQALIESISIVCVNCFLVITGWYGLRFKWKHIWTVYSILVFIYVPFYICNAVINNNFSIISLIRNFVAIGNENYYVNCYLMLIFLSPILNLFTNKYGKRILPYSIFFWFIEFSFDWVLGNPFLGFAYGYMLTHFILMYILGQTAFLFKKEINGLFSTLRCISIYLIGIVIITCMYFVIPLDISYAYSNPINIIMSFSLFFIFERHSFYNKTINWISKSTLAVYIIHCTPPIINQLQNWDNYVLSNYSYSMYLIFMAATIFVVFVGSILYDKMRCLFMPRLGDIIYNWISKKIEKYYLPQ